MFQMIVNYSYRRLPEAIDISGSNLHGFVHQPGAGFLADGASVGSGALSFDAPQCRVRIPDAAVFKRLFALKIEMVVRLRALGQRRNLIEGDNSFAFFIHPDGSLWGTAKGRETPSGTLDFYGASTAVPGGATVPLNRWTTLTYLHDGFSTIQVAIDGKVVATKTDMYSPILPVGALGVHIGNWPKADDFPFLGDIDDVKIWRWDPDAAYTQLFSRTLGNCWGGIFQELGRMATDPHGRRALIALLECLAAQQTALIRMVRSQGASVVERNEHYSRRYRELWTSGTIDGEEMKQLIEEWFNFLGVVIGQERLVEFLRDMAHCFSDHASQISTRAGEELADCDPQFHAYVKTLMDMEPVRRAAQ